jgi:hypothetical protein
MPPLEALRFLLGQGHAKRLFFVSFQTDRTNNNTAFEKMNGFNLRSFALLYFLAICSILSRSII